MTRGRSLHIGLNSIDPDHYGSDGALRGCENDARDMQAIARSADYRTQVLMTGAATSNAVVSAIRAAAKDLRAGDQFLVTYSGHGSQIPDRGGDEPDGLDETWVLYDRMLVDDELYALWGEFAPGVRILVLSDSCHSGTVLRARAYESMVALPEYRDAYSDVRPKYLDERASAHAYREHRDLYDNLTRNIPDERAMTVRASVILISGCQDNQLSMDGSTNGAFTEAVKRVWDGGRFVGDHRAFWKAAQGLLPGSQSPNYMFVGASDPAFEGARPFTLGSGRHVGRRRDGAVDLAWGGSSGDAIVSLVAACVEGVGDARRSARDSEGPVDAGGGREVTVGVSVTVRV